MCDLCHFFFFFNGHCNRQLAKLLSGNEVRGKVAIAAVQMTINFTRSRGVHREVLRGVHQIQLGVWVAL